MKKTRRDFIKMTGGAALGTGLMLGGLGKPALGASTPLKGVPSAPLKIGVIAPYQAMLLIMVRLRGEQRKSG